LGCGSLQPLIAGLAGCGGGGAEVRAPVAPASAPPAATDGPRFDRIDYAHPERYVAIQPSFGARATIEAAAAEVETTPDAEKQLIAIGRYLGRRLKYREHDAYAWRDVPTMLNDGTFGGCADHAVAFAALAREKKIPAVFVKTMDVDWIRKFARGGEREAGAWSGHVFLEVFIDGRWALLDATNLVLYRDYETTTRILPGNRYAYDKGDDPVALVLSPDWARWRVQTAAFFGRFDVATLPVGAGKSLKSMTASEAVHRLGEEAYVVCNQPYCRIATEKLQASGVRVPMSFNTKFEELLPKAASHALVVLIEGDKLVLPEQFWPSQTVITLADLKRRMEETSSGVFGRKRDDGTTVVVIYGRDAAALEKAIAAW
jgi:hypothetical protein